MALTPRNLTAALLCGALLAACSTAGPEIKRTEDFELTFTMDGFERHVQVHVPPGAPSGTPLPLLFVLHGSGMSGEIIRSVTQLDALADDSLFYVAYPDAYRTWATPGSPAAALGVDDVAFLAELLDRLERLLELDTDRIAVTGFSAGGFMTQALACSLSPRLAGAITVAGTMWDELAATCRPSRPISVLMVHGTLDNAVPIDGDAVLGRWSVARSAQFWADHDGCDVTPSDTLVAEDSATGIALRRSIYHRCDDGTSVQVDVLDGEGHQWSLSPFSVSELVSAFALRQHR